ncbi:MAG: AHH domain-containing protein [Legionellaceae bacterium]|nr:AHH domain-containing protein [Legionellaceae bacterium]
MISPTNSATKNHPLLKAAGFNNIDSRPNRIYLPTQPSQHPTRSIHRGRHRQAPMNAVARKMDDIHKRGRAENWNESQYRAELRKMLSENRQELRSGNIALNKNHRPWTQ